MKKRLFASLSSIALIAIMGASSVTAAGVPGETIPGNPVCDGTKIDPVTSGTYALAGGGTITIDVYDGANGPEFNFHTDGAHVVSSIMVKGGPNAVLWTFNPPDDHGNALHAPVNLKNPHRYWYGLSHLCVHSDKKVDGGGK